MTHRIDESRLVIGERAFDVRAVQTCDVDVLAAMSTGHIAGKRAFIAESLERRFVIGGFVDDRIAGYAVWDRAFFGRPFVWLLGVHPLFRRRGIGAALLAEVACACGGEDVFTSTNESNAAMHALLARHGYRQTGIVENLDPGDPEIFYVRTAAGYAG